jgi:hypothetical protein
MICVIIVKGFTDVSFKENSTLSIRSDFLNQLQKVNKKKKNLFSEPYDRYHHTRYSIDITMFIEYLLQRIKSFFLHHLSFLVKIAVYFFSVDVFQCPW